MRVSSRTTKPSTCGLTRFQVFRVDAVIADERIRHGDDLPLVGRIGQHFLVAGHAGVENDFAERFAGGAEAVAREDRAVLECQFRQRFRHALSRRVMVLPLLY